MRETRSARRRRRIGAFRLPWQAAIAEITAREPAVEDLADSFPALLFALATNYGSDSGRRNALACVHNGLPLKAAAQSLNLPLWTRRLPPRALSAPLPVVPADAEFALTVTSRLPPHDEDAGAWFDRVGHALGCMGRDYALWTAREPRLLPVNPLDEDFQWLTAWAWFGARPRTDAYRLIRRGWSPHLTWRMAKEEVALWRKRIDLVAALGPGISDPWFADGGALGLDIVALRTIDDFVHESEAMENCLDQYGPHLTRGRVRLFSVRKQTRSVATLELSLRSDDGLPSITQLRGPRNRRVPRVVCQAVQVWLESQPFRAFAEQPADAASMRRALAKLWQPYGDALDAAGLSDRFLPRYARASLLPRRKLARLCARNQNAPDTTARRHSQGRIAPPTGGRTTERRPRL